MKTKLLKTLDSVEMDSISRLSKAIKGDLDIVSKLGGRTPTASLVKQIERKHKAHFEEVKKMLETG